MAASNTIECIEELVGERLTGIIPMWETSDITSTKALVFESGRALVLGDNGSYWVAPAKDVQRKIARLRADYEKGVGALAKLVRLAGSVTEEAAPQ